MTNTEIDRIWRALRMTYGLVAFLAGLDKFFHLLTNWDRYVPAAVAGLLPVSTSVLMQAVGVIEMIAGILILTRWTRIGAYIVSVWLLLIAFDLSLAGSFFDIAVRDVALSVGAWALARLSEARSPLPARAGHETAGSPAHA
jgi:hypothetical protein